MKKNGANYYKENKEKDYQPSMKQFAGDQFGTANSYMERTDRHMDKDAGKLRKQDYKGRYD